MGVGPERGHRHVERPTSARRGRPGTPSRGADPSPHLPAVRGDVRPGDQDPRRPGHRGPRRPRRRVEQGLPVPQGRLARPACTTTRTGCACRWSARATSGARCRWDEAFARCEELLRPIVERGRHRRRHRVHRQSGGPQLLAEPLHRRGRRHPPDAGHLVGRHRRPVAEEPRLRAAFRQPVEHPHPRRAAHRSVRRDGRESAGVAGLAVLLPRHPGRDQAHPASAAGARSSSIPRRTGTAEKADEWIPIVPGMDAAFLLAIVHVLDAEGLINLGLARRAGCRASRRCCAAARAVHPRGGGRRLRRARRADPAAGPRARRRPSAPSSTAGSACATRSSARSPRGRSTSSTC